MSDLSNLMLRPFERADAAAVVELVNAAAEREPGCRRAVVDGAGNVRLSRFVPPGSEQVVAVDDRGVAIGYAYLAESEGAIVLATGGAVHPAHWGRGVGTRLAGWAVQRAQARAADAPAGVRTVLQANVFAGEPACAALLADQGFAPVREWVHMLIELDAPPEPPRLPAGLALRPMDLDSDWDAVGPAMDAAYADHWGVIPPGALAEDPSPGAENDDGEEPADSGDRPAIDMSFSNAPGLCFIALDGASVVGGVFCNGRLAERDDSGRVGSMFVRPELRGRGIGRALMLAAFGAFWARGTRRIILDTDAQSFTAAPRFYAGLGMRSYRREFVYERTIRPGRELRRLEL